MASTRPMRLQPLNRTDEAGIGRSGDGVISHLALALPILNIFYVASATEVDVLAGADEHVRGGDYVGNRVLLWIVAGDPDRDGDVVGGLAEGDGESAMETEQELGSSVVVRCGEGGERGAGGEREGVHCRRQSLAGRWAGGGGGGRRRRRRGVGWRRNEYFRAARSVWGREPSSDERIRNAQGDVIVCQG